METNKILNLLPKKFRYHFWRKKLLIKRLEGHEIQFKIAVNKEDLEAAFTLLKHNALKHGKVEAKISDIYCNIFHTLPQTQVLVAKCKGEVLACISLYCESKLGVPSDNVYKIMNDKARTRGYRLCEIGDFCVADSAQEQSRAIALYFSKYIYEYLLTYTECNMLCMNVSKDWYKMLSAIFNFSEILPVYEKFPKVSDTEVHAALDLKEFAHWTKATYIDYPVVSNLYSFVFCEKAPFDFPEKNNGQKTVLSQETFKYIFEKKSDVLKKAALPTLAYVRDMYRFYFNIDAVELFKRVDAHREHTRVQITLDASLQASDKVVFGKVFDISRFGVFIKTDELIKMNEEYALVFKWNEHLFTVRVIPMWHNNGENRKYPIGYGVRFLDENKKLAEFIANEFAEPNYGLTG